MMQETEITLTINGEEQTHRVPVRKNMVDFLRDDLGLTGTRVGCEQGICGACSIRFNGQVIRGCLLFAVQADGASVETIEGLAEAKKLERLQESFAEHNALQCGFCTTGMVLTANELIEKYPAASRDEIRDYISGNYCRCTGYQSIVDAIEAALRVNTESSQ